MSELNAEIRTVNRVLSRPLKMRVNMRQPSTSSGLDPTPETFIMVSVEEMVAARKAFLHIVSELQDLEWKLEESELHMKDMGDS